MKLSLISVLTFTITTGAQCLPVDQSSVTAGVLASAVPAFRSVPADRHLVWAPAPGLIRWLRVAELQRLAAREGVIVEAAASICLQRKTAVFSEEQVTRALRERLPSDAGLQIIEYCRLPMMSGRLRFEAIPAAPPKGEQQVIRWKGAVVGEDGRTAPFWATVRLQMRRRVIRAARVIPARSILVEEDVLETIEPLTSFQRDPSPPLSELVGKETTREIGAQQLIRPADLRTPQLVRIGQSVRVLVESGRTRLGLDARALGSGFKGDVLLVRNDVSGRTFKAEITGPGTARVRVETKSK